VLEVESKLKEAGETPAKRQQYIEELSKRLEEAVKVSEARQQYVLEVESKLKEAGETSAKRQEYIEELSERLRLALEDSLKRQQQILRLDEKLTDTMETSAERQKQIAKLMSEREGVLTASEQSQNRARQLRTSLSEAVAAVNSRKEQLSTMELKLRAVREQTARQVAEISAKLDQWINEAGVQGQLRRMLNEELRSREAELRECLRESGMLQAQLSSLQRNSHEQELWVQTVQSARWWKIYAALCRLPNTPHSREN
jgi:chromosome segregation ATPase